VPRSRSKHDGSLFKQHDALDDAVGLPGKGLDLRDPLFTGDPDAVSNLVAAMDPAGDDIVGDPPILESKPPNPFCPAT